MVKRILILPALALLLLAGGCTVQQEFTFNKDLSGKAVNQVDLSNMRLVMPRFDSTRSFSQMRDSVWNYTRQVADSLQALQGISNVQSQWKDSTAQMMLSYQFSGLSALNKAFAVTNPGNCATGNGCFAKGWRRFSFTAPQFIEQKQQEKIPESHSKKDFHYVLHLKFAGEVRRVKGDARVTAEGKGLRYQGNLFDAFGRPRSISFEAKVR